MLPIKRFTLLIFILPIICFGQNREEAKKLVHEMGPLFVKVGTLKLSKKKSESTKYLNRQLIKKLELIFKTDSTYTPVSDYLGDCYAFDNNPEKAIYW